MAQSAGQLGLNENTLTTIINQTTTTITDLNVLNSQVEATSGDIQRANISDSGRLTGTALMTWQEDFAKIMANLNELNTAATNMRTVLLNTTAQASQQTR